MRRPQPEIDKLVLDHYEAVYRALYRLSGRCEEASDLTQKTFLSALKSWHTYRGRCSVSGWLMRIAIRTWHASLKGRRSDEPLDQEMPALQDPSTAWLMELFDALPPMQREAFYLHEVEGYSMQEIAEIAGVAVGTVKARLHFARKNLQARLEAAQRSEEELLYATKTSRP